MGAVYRNGIPPKKMPYKAVMSIPDYKFSEENIVKWARENCISPVQYDFITFVSSNKILKRTYDLTIWFTNKRDHGLFYKQWQQWL